jgi:hypothetical protein
LKQEKMSDGEEGESSSSVDTEQEREQSMREVLDCFRQRNEPMMISQLSYHTNIYKSYLADDCLPFMKDQIASKRHQKQQLFFLPVRNCADKVEMLEDLELDELIELDTEI